MHAVFFEVRPHPGHLERYFEHVARLRPVLAHHTGMTFLDRYASLTEDDLLLSHQLWDSEESIIGWRADAVHRKSQTAGRQVHFADYRIRVGARVLHWLSDATDSSSHGETGSDAPHEETNSDAPHVVALYSTHPMEASGFRSFESVNRQGKFIALTTVDGRAAAEAAVRAQRDASGLEEAAAYSIRRDYGQFDRSQAPGDTGSA